MPLPSPRDARWDGSAWCQHCRGCSTASLCQGAPDRLSAPPLPPKRAAPRLALIPASAKRAGGTNFELAVARGEETPQGLVGADIKARFRKRAEESGPL
jgi:hypothetical protein